MGMVKACAMLEAESKCAVEEYVKEPDNCDKEDTFVKCKYVNDGKKSRPDKAVSNVVCESPNARTYEIAEHSNVECEVGNYWPIPGNIKFSNFDIKNSHEYG